MRALHTAVARAVTPAAAGVTALVAALLLLWSPAVARAADQVPYSDPAVTGGLTLCGVDGKPVLSGKVTDKPFVWRVIGDSAAQGTYRDAGRTAFLVAYQPREGFAPGAWSGYQIGAASTYATVAHPTVQMTPRSSRLDEFLSRYTPVWDGYVQLRVLLTGSNRSVYREKYDATDIRVVGDTWHVVRGGTASCSSGTGTSTSVLLKLPGAKGTPSPGAVASPPPLTTTPVAQLPATAAGTPTAGGTTPPTLIPTAVAGHGIAGASLLPVLLAAAAAAGLAVLATLLVQRRSS